MNQPKRKAVKATKVSPAVVAAAKTAAASAKVTKTRVPAAKLPAPARQVLQVASPGMSQSDVERVAQLLQERLAPNDAKTQASAVAKADPVTALTQNMDQVRAQYNNLNETIRLLNAALSPVLKSDESDGSDACTESEVCYYGSSSVNAFLRDTARNAEVLNGKLRALLRNLDI